MQLLNIDWYRPIFQGFLFGLMAMTFHEAAHIAAALALGVKVKKVGLNRKGLYTVRDAGPLNKNFLIALAGPTINLALMLSWQLSPTFGLANTCFAAFNLLPIAGSDGLRVLHCWQKMHTKYPFSQ